MNVRFKHLCPVPASIRFLFEIPPFHAPVYIQLSKAGHRRAINSRTLDANIVRQTKVNWPEIRHRVSIRTVKSVLFRPARLGQPTLDTRWHRVARPFRCRHRSRFGGIPTRWRDDDRPLGWGYRHPPNSQLLRRIIARLLSRQPHEGGTNIIRPSGSFLDTEMIKKVFF